MSDRLGREENHGLQLPPRPAWDGFGSDEDTVVEDPRYENPANGSAAADIPTHGLPIFSAGPIPVSPRFIGQPATASEHKVSVEQLIRADPDEESQGQAEPMAIFTDRPYIGGINLALSNLIARVGEGERHRRQMETQLNLAFQLIQETKDNQTAASRAPQAETGRDDSDSVAEGGRVFGKSAAPVNKRRSLPQDSGGTDADDMNRAKRTRPNTAGSGGGGAAEGVIHSDPLPAPAADRTVSLLLRPRALAPPVARKSGVPSAAADIDAAAPLANDDEDAGVKWAREFLSFLKAIDCRSDTDLLRLRRYVDGQLSFEFPLCLSTEMGLHAQYYLKVGGKLSTLIRADPHDMERPVQPKADEELVDKLNILEYAVDERRIESAAKMDVDHKPVYPSGYLVPLGEVFVAHRSSTKPQEVASTNFFVLMEATSSKKSLWMAYRYEKPVRRRDGTTAWDAVVVLNHRDSVFKGSRRHFDTVAVLDDVRQWRSPTEDMIDMCRFAEALPRGGSNVLQPVLYTPVLAAVREAMKKGWEEGAVDEE
ncbi:hypothetical protein N658DRAFT_509086 [Parathielavia hyrcaniae]|uniref:Uncharacterized protein n=1 Tax=Parathielavia hyrcaniae TaxID=113614 RepID=A0AAN6PWD8_9PEZI|nr:hypothetical protein N658DRAFT_509086 [Parathielavia hyrcaniae]